MTDAEPGPDRARSIFETLRASNLFGKPADREAEVVDPNGNPRDSARDDGSPTNFSPEQTGARPNEAAAPSPGQDAVGASAERTSDPPSTDGSDPRPMDGQGATEAPSDGQGATEAPSALSSLGPDAVDEQPAQSGPEQRDGLSEIRLEQASRPDLPAGGDVGESASASPAPTSPQTDNAGSPPSGATTESANAGPPPAPTSPEGANAGPPPAPTSPEGANAGSPPPGATPHPGPVAAAASVDSHETGAPAPAEPSDLVSAPSEKLPQNPPGSSSETASEPPGQASDLPETPASALGAPSADAPGGEEAPAAPTRPAAQLAEAPDAGRPALGPEQRGSNRAVRRLSRERNGQYGRRLGTRLPAYHPPSSGSRPPSAAGPRRRQPEGWGGQDDDNGEPGCSPRRARLPGAGGGPRPAR